MQVDLLVLPTLAADVKTEMPSLGGAGRRLAALRAALRRIAFRVVAGVGVTSRWTVVKATNARRSPCLR